MNVHPSQLSSYQAEPTADQKRKSTDQRQAVNSTERTITWFVIGLLMILMTIRLWSADPLRSANDRSRWCTVWSLVERGTYQIDEIRNRRGWDTIDKVRHEDHYYSSKPPLLPTMVAGGYWGLKKLTGWTLTADTADVVRIILWFLNVLPFCFAVYLLQLMARPYLERRLARFLFLLLCSFATLLLPFLITFNNHTVAATGLVLSLWALNRVINQGSEKPASYLTFAMVGLFAAWTVCNELPAAAYGLASFFIVVSTSFKRTALAYVPAALLVLGAFFYTNYLATGGIKPFYAYYGTGKYEYVDEYGIPSYWMQPRGVDKSIDTPTTYLMHCTIGHHGVLSLTPIFLLTIAGWGTTLITRKQYLGLIHALGVLLSIAVFAFYLSRTANYNYGGVSTALRWVLWLIPFWLLAIVPTLDWISKTRAGQIFCFLLLIPSLWAAWQPWASPWQQPWIFGLMQQKGWIDYSDTPEPFSHKMYSWLAELPKGAEKDDDYWATFSSYTATGEKLQFTLADEGPVEGSSQNIRTLSLAGDWLRHPQLPERFTFQVNSQKFRSGEFPHQWIVSISEDLPKALRKPLYQFLHGMPKYREYRPGFMRYLRTPIRKTAFACQRAASQINVEYEEETQKRVVNYRSDLWLSKSVPFGNLRWQQAITDLRSPEHRQVIIWEVSAMGKDPTVLTLPTLSADIDQPGVEVVEPKTEQPEETSEPKS